MKRLRLAVVLAGADIARAASRFTHYLARKSVQVDGLALDGNKCFLKVRTRLGTADLEEVATRHQVISAAFAHS